MTTKPDCSSFYHPQRSWGKVIFSQASVNLLTGGCLVPGVGGGVCSEGGVCSAGCRVPGGLPGPGGCLLLGEGSASRRGVCSGGCLVLEGLLPGGVSALVPGVLLGGYLVETPPPPGRPLLRTVRIQLEYILVQKSFIRWVIFYSMFGAQKTLRCFCFTVCTKERLTIKKITFFRRSPQFAIFKTTRNPDCSMWTITLKEHQLVLTIAIF